MASATTLCTPCLRALRISVRAVPKNIQRQTNPIAPRTFTTTTTPLLHQPQQPSYAPPNPTEPPPPPPPPKTPPPPPKNAFENLASTLRTTKALNSTTEPYVAYGSTEDLYLLCSKPLSYNIPARNASPPAPPPTNAEGQDIGVPDHPNTFWFRPRERGGLGLDVTFANWTQIIFLHLYILTVRLRTFPAENAKVWHQQLLDHFFYAAEDRMVTWHAISARSVRNKYLKDMWNQWRGIIFSYDEGLVKGDAVLAGAVWRNLFKGDVETDVADVAKVVAYLRAELARMDKVSDAKLAAAGIAFGDPTEVGKDLGRRSGWMAKRFEEGEGEKTTMAES